MIIDFAAIEEKHIPYFKGGEGETISRMFTNELGKIMLGRLEPGSTIGYHRHDTSSEIIYIARRARRGEKRRTGPLSGGLVRLH